MFLSYFRSLFIKTMDDREKKPRIYVFSAQKRNLKVERYK